MTRLKKIGFAAALTITVVMPARAQVSPLQLAISIRACQQIATDAERLACFDRLVGPRKNGTATEPADTGWKTYARTDPIDDSKSAIAQVDNTGPAFAASFAIRCTDGRFSSLVTFAREYFTDDVRRVAYRLDEEPPETWTMYIAVSKKAYGIWDHASAERFTKMLAGHKQLALRIEKSTGERVDAVFAIDGVDAAVTEIRGECGGQ